MLEVAVLATPIGGLAVRVGDGAVVNVAFGAESVDGERDPTRVDPTLGDPTLDDPAIGPSLDTALDTALDTGPDTGLDPTLSVALVELTEYFAGDRTEFAVPIALARGSDFERAVWLQIASIPYGQTRTYGAIAHAVGEPGGAQAVGMACNRNPLPVLVACHRVIGAGGKLVGFGGGLPRKRFLLQLEAKVAIERGLDPGV